jgi:hypothetical protein
LGEIEKSDVSEKRKVKSEKRKMKSEKRKERPETPPSVNPGKRK